MNKILIPMLIETEDKKIIVFWEQISNKYYHINAQGLAEENKTIKVQQELKKSVLPEGVMQELKKINEIFNK